MFRNKTDKWYHVHVNEQDIVCTAGHPFYVADLETFVTANDLKVGQNVLLADGTCAVIEEIRVQKLRAPETTYNFEVEDYHTYYVSDDKVLVHNMCVEADFYRGGNDMTLKPNEYIVKDGLVVPGKDGVSINLDITEAEKHGKPYKVVSIPNGLTIAQKGSKLSHYVIRPKMPCR